VFKENKRLNYKARVLCHQCVFATIIQNILKAVTLKQVWDTLKQIYENSKKIKKVKLQSFKRHYEILSTTEL